MNWRDQCAAVIPCFNESARVAEVVAGARAHLEAVIVVDDGSTDGTAERATTAGAEVVRHEANRGKGAALQTGLQRAQARGFKWALVMDGDGQHLPEDIPALLAAATSDDAHLIVGNRMNETRSMPAVRRLVNGWMSKRISRLTGQHLPDTQCGFRLVHLESWSGLSLQTSRFEIESEMLIAFLAANKVVRFVPVKTIYRAEQSKIHPVRDTLRWLRWWRTTQRAWRARGTRTQV